MGCYPFPRCSLYPALILSANFSSSQFLTSIAEAFPLVRYAKIETFKKDNPTAKYITSVYFKESPDISKEYELKIATIFPRT